VDAHIGRSIRAYICSCEQQYGVQVRHTLRCHSTAHTADLYSLSTLSTAPAQLCLSTCRCRQDWMSYVNTCAFLRCVEGKSFGCSVCAVYLTLLPLSSTSSHHHKYCSTHTPAFVVLHIHSFLPLHGLLRRKFLDRRTSFRNPAPQSEKTRLQCFIPPLSTYINTYPSNSEQSLERYDYSHCPDCF
jgi:hypothetical protein